MATDKKLNNLVDFKTFTENDLFKENKPTKRTGVAKDVLKEELETLNEREDPDVKGFVFPKSHSSVTDDKDHFPIGTPSHARNALSRMGAFSSPPKWYSGTLENFKNTIRQAVKKRYTSIEVSDED